MSKERVMHAWEVDECTTVAAKTAEEALDWYLEDTGVDPEDCNPLEEITEASDSMVVVDEERILPSTTIGEILDGLDVDGVTAPQVICSSVY